MSTTTRAESPYPFVPLHVSGSVVERDGAHFVVWWRDASVQVVPGQEDVTLPQLRLEAAIVSVLEKGRVRPGGLFRELEQLGYKRVADVRFNFMSGSLYQNAIHLAVQSRRAEETRLELMKRHGGEFPTPESPFWPKWFQTITSRNASAMGARLLAFASLEALANEILFVRFPEVYQKLEGGRRKTFLLAKLKRLCEEAGIRPEPVWISVLADENADRRGIAHHEPGYIYERAENEDKPSRLLSSEAVDRLIFVVDEVFEDIFRAFGTGVPGTHKPERP